MIDIDWFKKQEKVQSNSIKTHKEVIMLAKYLPKDPIEAIIFLLCSIAFASGSFVMKEGCIGILQIIGLILLYIFDLLICINGVLFIYYMNKWYSDNFSDQKL